MRLREQARRTVVRAVLGTIALGFVAAAVVFAHLAVWYWLRPNWGELDIALAMAAADLVIAVLLLWLAACWSPGRVEREALAVRRRAWDGAAVSVAMSALVLRLLRQLVTIVSRKRSKPAQ